MDRGSLRQAFHWALSGSPALLLPLLSLLLYFPVLHHDFILDDQYLVVGNPYIKSWKYLPQMLSQDIWNIWDHQNYWRPVFTASLALDYSLWGLDAAGFHLTSVLLHATNTTLLYSLGRNLQNERSAAWASLLFALHPIQAQPINVISMRGELLAVFFGLLALHAFLARKTIFFAIAFSFALLSKEISIVLPAALLLFAWLVVERDHQYARVALAFVILGIYLAARSFLGFSFSVSPSVFSYDEALSTRWLLAFKALALYFIALLNLFEMPHPAWTVDIPTSVYDPYVVSGLCASALLIGAIWVNFRKLPVVAFGLGWFVIYFLPISNLKELSQPMAEHWLYIPMAGLSLAFGTAVGALSVCRFSGARIPRLAITTTVMFFLFLAVPVVREKTRLYQNEESFLTAAIRANPNVARLYSLLGNVYVAKKNILRAKAFYTQSIALDPADFAANYALGQILYQEGRKDEAKAYLEQVIRVGPLLKLQVTPVAHAWEMLGDKQRALFYYRKALDLNPESDELKQKVVSLEKTK